MTRRALLLAVLACAAGPAFGQHDDEREDPGAKFREIMEKQKDVELQILDLKELVQTHPRCIWTDDALWALGQICMKHRRWDEAIAYKSRLVEKYPPGRIHLEAYTRRLPLYRRSSIPALSRALREMGRVPVDHRRLYGFVKKSQRRMIVDPTSPALYMDLAGLYRRRGDYVNAARFYRLLIQALPPEGYLTKFVRESYEEIRDLAEYQRLQRAAARKKEPAKSKPAPPTRDDRLREMLRHARPNRKPRP